MTFRSISPATGKTIREFPPLSETELEKKLNRSKEKARIWRTTSFADRRLVLLNVASILAAEKTRWAELITAEMGKKTPEAVAEVEKCAATAKFYADHGEEFLTAHPVATEARKSYVCFEPLGTVLAVMPWNFPLWQAFRCALPALFAGNTVLLKHASNVFGCALAIEEIFERAGADQAFQSLLVSGERAEALIADPRVHAVSFTGSTEVGRKIAAAAGKHLKKSLLELGGSDPYLVLADADLEAAAKICAASRLICAGQSCIAAKRFIVEESVHDEFVDIFLKEMRQAEVAPLAKAEIRTEVHKQVENSVDKNALVRLGGRIPAGEGNFYPATVLTNVRPGMPAFDEEIFGPVAAVVKAKDDKEAIALANQTVYGLGAAVFSKDLERAEKIARHHLEAGSCFVNAFVRSDPRLPFGGVKDSGYGRELSVFGLREFTNVKTVYIG